MPHFGHEFFLCVYELAAGTGSGTGTGTTKCFVYSVLQNDDSVHEKFPSFLFHVGKLSSVEIT